MDQKNLAAKFELSKCIRCRKCTKNCLSAKHGGIDPSDTVFAVREGTYGGDPWTCLMCHRCSMVCPKGIAVAGLILALRFGEVREGRIPDRFVRVYSKFKEVGDTMSIVGSTDEERNALGLPGVCRDPDIPEKLRKMAGRSL